MHRAKAIQLIWLARAKTDTLITGDALDLSQLFRPATFLNAYRQTVARQLRRNMDELSLQCQWGGGGDGGGGLKLTGIQMQVGDRMDTPLFIQGAQMDSTGGVLRDVRHDAAPISNMPQLTLQWLPTVSYNFKFRKK
jgi:hypothetical protein